MKRHPALIPLSRDHHDGLVQAVRLRRAAADGDASARLAAAGDFVEFFRNRLQTCQEIDSQQTRPTPDDDTQHGKFSRTEVTQPIDGRTTQGHNDAVEGAKVFVIEHSEDQRNGNRRCHYRRKVGHSP